jgi:hypothetical protein
VILLMPLAIGFALTRPDLAVTGWIPIEEWRSRWRGMIDHNERIASPFISVVMPGLLVLRLRRPRPGLRRLSRQPGAVACAAATAAMALGGVVVGARLLFVEAALNSDMRMIWSGFQVWISPAVMAAWAALILGRRWRGERSWIDRAGRLCGFYWIALSVYRTVMAFVGG